MSKMNNWFPSILKPVRAGVYEVHTPVSRANRYAYFDGKQWFCCVTNLIEAKGAIPGSTDIYSHGAMWRGFTEKQK